LRAAREINEETRHRGCESVEHALQPLFYRNITIGGSPAPVRAYMDELLPDIMEGRIQVQGDRYPAHLAARVGR